MARGATSAVGTERTSPNGYVYVKTLDRGWVLKHWLVWEAANGKRVTENLQIRFVDGNKRNLSPANLIAIEKGKVTLRRRIATLEARIADDTAELELLKQELKETNS
jgi:hypothetical protein